MGTNPPQDLSFVKTGIRKLLSEGFLNIFVHIQQFLDPVDILALRLTGKSFSDVTRVRTVWVNAVQNACTTHGAFLPSFPLKEMSLNDLEHAALSPNYFRAIIRKHDGQSASPCLTTVFAPRIQPRQLSDAATQTTMDKMALIPGGRFLLTSTSSGNLFLWDLGFNPGSQMKLFPIATLKDSENSQGPSIPAGQGGFSFNYGPMANSGGIYIVTNTSTAAYSTADIVCYEIYPNSEFPNFRRIGAAVLGKTTTETTTLSSDYYACSQGSRFAVWKFTADLGISWDVGNSPNKIYISGENIITFHPTDYVLWKLPDLQPLGNNLLPHIDHPEKMAFCYPFPYKNIVVLPSPWLPQAAQKDFLIFGLGQNLAMRHFVIKSVDVRDDPLLPAILPLQVGSMQGGPGTMLSQDLIVTEGGLLQMWVSEGRQKILADLIYMPTAENPTYSSVSSALWTRKESSGNMKDYVICPMTGRVVINLKNNNAQRLEVVDFILPRALP